MDLLPRDGTVIEDFHVEDPELIYATHHINAYEDDNSIVLGRKIILKEFLRMYCLITLKHEKCVQCSGAVQQTVLPLVVSYSTAVHAGHACVSVLHQSVLPKVV